MATLSKAASHSEHHHGAPTGFVKRWLNTTKHKDIGTMYIIFAIIAAIIGGAIGNNVTKNVDNGGAVGALLGGMLAHQNSDATGGTKRVCKIETRYNESSAQVYSHSVVTFFSNGKQYSLRFNK